MAEAYIVDAIRSPVGKRRGKLAHLHGADLGAHMLKALVARNPSIPAEDYDDVVFGCLDAIGPLAGNIARSCWLAAGLPLTVPGVTIDRQCGSSQQALHFAAQALATNKANASVYVSHAKLAAGEAAWLSARRSMQVHGAMGYTWEADLQMFMKRAWALDAAWGDRAFHKTRVANHIFTSGAALGPGETFN